MCGRFSLIAVSQAITDRFAVEVDEPISPRYNIAPGQITPVILNSSQERISMARWGFIPHFFKEERPLINARAETLLDTVFKAAFLNQRCLVLADGFYEWRDTPAGKLPYRFTAGKLFAFAGIYDIWNNILTYSIITTEPNDTIKAVHDRMPAILAEEDERRWLEQQPIDRLKIMLKPYEGKMDAYEVSTRLNSIKNDDPGVIEPVSRKTLFDF